MNKSSSTDLGFTRQIVPVGTHTALIFGDEEKKNRLILQFLVAGIRRGEKVVGFMDSMTKEEVLTWLNNEGVDTGNFNLESGLIIKRTKAMYYPDGSFSPEEMPLRWRRLAEEAMEEGFSAVRVTGETTWLLRHVPGTERFVEYEEMINEFLKDYPVTVICQFDANYIKCATLLEIVNAHPTLTVNGQIMYNPCYFTTDLPHFPCDHLPQKKDNGDLLEKHRVSTILLVVAGILEILPTLQKKVEFTESVLETVLKTKEYHLCVRGYVSRSILSGYCRGCQAANGGKEYPYYTCPLTGRPDLVGYEIKTADFFFGHLFLSQQSAEGVGMILPSFYNYLNLLALSLENSIQEERLQRLNAELKAEIQKKERIEVVLRQNEERIKAVMAGTDEGFWELDLTSGVMEYDENWGRILGYEPGEVKCDSKWFSRNVHPDHQGLFVQALQDYVKGKKKYFEVEYKIRTKSGGWKWVWTRGVSLTGDERKNTLKLTGTNRDITIYQQTKEALHASVTELAAEKGRAELLKMQKLESLGVLAGGIAHDFNNLLAAILSNVQLATFKLKKGLDGIKDLQAVEKATLKAAKLTKQLLVFSKGGAPVKQTAKLSEIIRETAEFALRGTPVRCKYFLSDHLWAVEIDGGQISQVIHNLTLNAYHAMPEGGEVRIFADNEVLSAENHMQLKPGKYVKVEIEDEGIGIPGDTLTKIFDPYFTTKEQGNGLGLSTSYYIIKNHDGYIGARSKVGFGSTFYIYLPASEKTPSSEGKGRNTLPEGKGKILLMDDEPLIRRSVREFLVNCGYQVSVAKDGLEAVKLYKEGIEHSSPFDVVVMDLTVPGGMGGKKAVKDILSIDSKAKVIVSSGYSNDPVMSDYEKYGFCNVVIKPYTMEELGKKIMDATQST